VSQPQKILIFRQSSLGDVILTLPVLERLKDKYPECQIDFLTKKAYGSLIRDQPSLNKLYTFADSLDFIKIASSLTHEKYDILVDLQANFRSMLLRTIGLPQTTLVYDKRRLAREMLIRRPYLKREVNHTVEAYLEALKPLGIEPTIETPKLFVPHEKLNSATRFLFNNNLDKVNKLIAFCPGARHYEKRWPHQFYRDVALALLEKSDIGIIVLTTSEEDIPRTLNIDSPRIISVMNFELLDIAAILSKCKVALTNDSGLMHLANAVGTPVLAIFGPTNPRLGFSPTLPGSDVICDDVPCSPCSLHGKKPCSQPEKYCFKNITPDRVFNKLLQMI
jgi:heptosyltransferase II